MCYTAGVGSLMTWKDRRTRKPSGTFQEHTAFPPIFAATEWQRVWVMSPDQSPQDSGQSRTASPCDDTEKQEAPGAREAWGNAPRSLYRQNKLSGGLRGRPEAGTEAPTWPTYRPLVSLAGNKNMLMNSIRMLGATLEVFAEYTSHL